MSQRYINPDKRCTYPAHGWDYCWGYANNIDGEKHTKEYCKDCEYWKDTTHEE